MVNDLDGLNSRSHASCVPDLFGSCCRAQYKDGLCDYEGDTYSFPGHDEQLVVRAYVNDPTIAQSAAWARGPQMPIRFQRW
ncbi:MAG: hypothetical protein ABI912_01885 [Actinomycetota bacterium]